jgi:hypothetical protein
VTTGASVEAVVVAGSGATMYAWAAAAVVTGTGAAVVGEWMTM